MYQYSNTSCVHQYHIPDTLPYIVDIMNSVFCYMTLRVKLEGNVGNNMNCWFREVIKIKLHGNSCIR